MNGMSAVWVWTTVVSFGRPLPAALGRRFLEAGVARGHVDARQTLVELDGGRDLPGQEAEMGEEPRSQLLGVEAEGEAVGHLGENEGGHGQDQLPVLRRRFLLQDFQCLRESRRAPGRVGSDHAVIMGAPVFGAKGRVFARMLP